ncbi:MAG: murein transglycosylase A [Planctomycetota bacterium]|jgi:membrane-bound lytic murein transglycosylase A
MAKRSFLFFILILAFVLNGCGPKAKDEEFLGYDRPLGPGEQALVKITNPYEIPDFTLACIDLDGLEGGIDRSLSYLKKPSSKQFFPICGISHERVVKSLETFKGYLGSGMTEYELNQAIRDNFDVYMSVGCDKRGTVLFTGYYTPIFEGSWEQTGENVYPLYKKPKDLVKGAFGEVLGRQMSDGTIQPYPSRFIIEVTNMLEGQELIWLKDAFEAYVAQVQGSAKVRLPDGELVTVGYAANNGHDYKSVSTELVNDGKISGDELSLPTMIDYFKRNPGDVETYLNRNPRYVFFRKEEGAPRGSLNEPVTPMRTIATDKSIFPRASLTFVMATLPQERNGVIVQDVYSGFTLDQDTGGAIRAPGRCDFYMGIGDEAGQLAGRTRREGKLYYLFLKESYDIPTY